MIDVNKYRGKGCFYGKSVDICENVSTFAAEKKK